jgi:large subunit ribosomal protein L29
MRAEKLREMTVDELRLQETQLQDQIFRLRFQIAASQAENPARVHLLRKDLARVKTVIRQKVGPRLTGRAAATAAAAVSVAAPAAPAAERAKAPAPAKAAKTRTKAKAGSAAAAPAGRKREGREASAREGKGARQGAKR